MPLSCPHCQEAIEDAVTKSSMLERINQVNAAKKLTEDALSVAQVKASAHDAMALENGELKSQIAAATEKTARGDAFRERAIDASHMGTFETLYNAAQAGAEQPSTFAEFLDGAAKANPLLASAYGKPADPSAPPPAAAPVVTAPRPTPNLDANTDGPPPPAGKMTPAQLSVHLNGLSDADATTWMDEHRSEYS